MFGIFWVEAFDRKQVIINTNKKNPMMEAHDIVKRVAYATIPPTVEYTLTEKGRKLQPILKELYKWGKEYY